jgi:hypothetical protein
MRSHGNVYLQVTSHPSLYSPYPLHPIHRQLHFETKRQTSTLMVYCGLLQSTRKCWIAKACFHVGQVIEKYCGTYILQFGTWIPTYWRHILLHPVSVSTMKMRTVNCRTSVIYLPDYTVPTYKTTTWIFVAVEIFIIKMHIQYRYRNPDDQHNQEALLPWTSPIWSQFHYLYLQVFRYVTPHRLVKISNVSDERIAFIFRDKQEKETAPQVFLKASTDHYRCAWPLGTPAWRWDTL